MLQPIVREGSRVIQNVGSMRAYLSLTNVTTVVCTSITFLFTIVQINDSIAEILPSSWAARITIVFEGSLVKKTLDSIRDRFSPRIRHVIETSLCLLPVLVRKIDAIMNLLPTLTWMMQNMASAVSRVTRTLDPISDRFLLAFSDPVNSLIDNLPPFWILVLPSIVVGYAAFEAAPIVVLWFSRPTACPRPLPRGHFKTKSW